MEPLVTSKRIKKVLSKCPFLESRDNWRARNALVVYIQGRDVNGWSIYDKRSLKANVCRNSTFQVNRKKNART